MGETGGADSRWVILVVDDDELSRDLVSQYLAKLNLRNPVVHAVDGDQACTVLSDETLTPVLVLLDQQMPRRSGLEVLRWMRERPRFADLPIVMLTGSAELDEVEEAYRLGITSYLVKPVGFSALQDVLHRIGLPWLVLPPGRQEQG